MAVMTYDANLTIISKLSLYVDQYTTHLGYDLCGSSRPLHSPGFLSQNTVAMMNLYIRCELSTALPSLVKTGRDYRT